MSAIFSETGSKNDDSDGDNDNGDDGDSGGGGGWPPLAWIPVACCSPPCESTRVARTDAPCAQKGARSRVHAARLHSHSRSRSHATVATREAEEGERKGKGGERRGCYMCVRTYAQSNGREASVSCSRLATASRFSRENISDRSIFLDEKKKKEFIYRHFRSLAQNYRQNKIILENRKEKRDKKKEKCTRRDCVVFPKRMGT